MKYIVSVNSKTLKELKYNKSKSKLVETLVREYEINKDLKDRIDCKIIAPPRRK